METKTCEKCGSTGLVWNKAKSGKWYLGVPVVHTFEDGNQVTTHVAAHDCQPTPEGLAIYEAKVAERAAAKAAEQAKLDAIAAEAAKLRHVAAEVGEQVNLTGVVTMATTIESTYGTQMLIVLKTANYEVAKIITTANWAWSVDFEDVVTVTATVKQHSEYEGKPQTVLTRPKLQPTA